MGDFTIYPYLDFESEGEELLFNKILLDADGGISKDDANYFMNLSSMSRNLDNKESENLLKAPKTVQKT